MRLDTLCWFVMVMVWAVREHQVTKEPTFSPWFVPTRYAVHTWCARGASYPPYRWKRRTNASPGLGP